MRKMARLSDNDRRELFRNTADFSEYIYLILVLLLMSHILMRDLMV